MADLRTPEARAKAEDERLLREYADKVANHEMGFEQAGCEYRGGEWDYGNWRCIPASAVKP
jgi:hypothetical protein